LKSSIEYGITERLQVELALPYQQSRWYKGDERHQVSSIGNSEFEIAYHIVQQSQNLPAISISFGVETPASNKEPIRTDNWGYEASVNSSKYIDGLGFIHTSFGYQSSEKGDESEVNYGIGFVYPLSGDFSTVIEYVVEKETEKQYGVKEKETIAQLSLGLTYQYHDSFVIGFAYGCSDDKHSLDHFTAIKIQYEF
jgi:hypothetical protein